MGSITDGSSPLARGLRPEPRPLLRHRRIIPARAGFTRPETADRRPQGDHPRSRGVYNGKPARTTWAGGSSPLARGLLGLATIADTQWRIIPARAGFTMGAWRSRPRTPDHPRSRGVYRAERIEDDEEFGSSPLARGLLLAEHPHREEDGIIPARAGFTRRRLRRRRRSRDHPRSRGVYTLTATGLGEQQGSSPLARGLRQMLILFCAGDGIIPARAGFTDRHRASRGAAQDHPRSRGVYASTTGAAPSRAGSSPLARGLPALRRILSSRAGIIPARAGFTGVAADPLLPGGDHPRSRGVYPAGSHCGAWPWGSSPLARGLPQGASGVVLGGRIIPARAGFTSNGCPTTPRPGDHPRSRGVYRAPRRSHPGCAGSSPLARGLPGYKGWRVIVMGIIPARAGFTRRRVTLTGDFRDHPRSRGVYVTHTMFRLPETGSSPLARGLRDGAGPHAGARTGSSPLARGLLAPRVRARARVGIIPARAGFTRPLTGPRRAPRDHPRSRGVYPSTWPTPTGGSGSSPLARGLLGQHCHHGRGRGIIPARAGFTIVVIVISSIVGDHPRSRGVY